MVSYQELQGQTQAQIVAMQQQEAEYAQAQKQAQQFVAQQPTRQQLQGYTMQSIPARQEFAREQARVKAEVIPQYEQARAEIQQGQTELQDMADWQQAQDIVAHGGLTHQVIKHGVTDSVREKVGTLWRQNQEAIRRRYESANKPRPIVREEAGITPTAGPNEFPVEQAGYQVIQQTGILAPAQSFFDALSTEGVIGKEVTKDLKFLGIKSPDQRAYEKALKEYETDVNMKDPWALFANPEEVKAEYDTFNKQAEVYTQKVEDFNNAVTYKYTDPNGYLRPEYEHEYNQRVANLTYDKMMLESSQNKLPEIPKSWSDPKLRERGEGLQKQYEELQKPSYLEKGYAKATEINNQLNLVGVGANPIGVLGISPFPALQKAAMGKISAGDTSLWVAEAGRQVGRAAAQATIPSTGLQYEPGVRTYQPTTTDIIFGQGPPARVRGETQTVSKEAVVKGIGDVGYGAFALGETIGATVLGGPWVGAAVASPFFKPLKEKLTSLPSEKFLSWQTPVATIAEFIPTTPLEVGAYWAGGQVLGKIPSLVRGVGFTGLGGAQLSTAETAKEKWAGIMTLGIGLGELGARESKLLIKRQTKMTTRQIKEVISPITGQKKTVNILTGAGRKGETKTEVFQPIRQRAYLETPRRMTVTTSIRQYQQDLLNINKAGKGLFGETLGGKVFNYRPTVLGYGYEQAAAKIVSATASQRALAIKTLTNQGLTQAQAKSYLTFRKPYDPLTYAVYGRGVQFQSVDPLTGKGTQGVGSRKIEVPLRTTTQLNIFGEKVSFKTYGEPIPKGTTATKVLGITTGKTNVNPDFGISLLQKYGGTKYEIGRTESQAKIMIDKSNINQLLNNPKIMNNPELAKQVNEAKERIGAGHESLKYYEKEIYTPQKGGKITTYSIKDVKSFEQKSAIMGDQGVIGKERSIIDPITGERHFVRTATKNELDFSQPDIRVSDVAQRGVSVRYNAKGKEIGTYITGTGSTQTYSRLGKGYKFETIAETQPVKLKSPDTKWTRTMDRFYGRRYRQNMPELKFEVQKPTMGDYKQRTTFVTVSNKPIEIGSNVGKHITADDAIVTQLPSKVKWVKAEKLNPFKFDIEKPSVAGSKKIVVSGTMDITGFPVSQRTGTSTFNVKQGGTLKIAQKKIGTFAISEGGYPITTAPKVSGLRATKVYSPKTPFSVSFGKPTPPPKYGADLPKFSKSSGYYYSPEEYPWGLGGQKAPLIMIDNIGRVPGGLLSPTIGDLSMTAKTRMFSNIGLTAKAAPTLFDTYVQPKSIVMPRVTSTPVIRAVSSPTTRTIQSPIVTPILSPIVSQVPFMTQIPVVIPTEVVTPVVTQTQIVTPVVTPIVVPIVTPVVTPVTTPIITPTPFIQPRPYPFLTLEKKRKFKPEPKKKGVPGFLVMTKKRGKPFLISRQPLEKGQALSVGLKYTKRTERATFKLVPTKEKATRLFGVPSITETQVYRAGYRPPVKKGKYQARTDVFIQKTPTRMGTFSERKAIQQYRRSNSIW